MFPVTTLGWVRNHSVRSSGHQGQVTGSVTDICMVSRDLGFQIQSLLFENKFKNYDESNISTQLNIQYYQRHRIKKFSLPPRLPDSFSLIIIYCLSYPNISIPLQVQIYTNHSFLSNTVDMPCFFSLNGMSGRSFHISSFNSCVIIQCVDGP